MDRYTIPLQIKYQATESAIAAVRAVIWCILGYNSDCVSVSGKGVSCQMWNGGWCGDVVEWECVVGAPYMGAGDTRRHCSRSIQYARHPHIWCCPTSPVSPRSLPLVFALCSSSPHSFCLCMEL